jgi:hypothetical protein
MTLKSLVTVRVCWFWRARRQSPSPQLQHPQTSQSHTDLPTSLSHQSLTAKPLFHSGLIHYTQGFQPMHHVCSLLPFTSHESRTSQPGQKRGLQYTVPVHPQGTIPLSSPAHRAASSSEPSMTTYCLPIYPQTPHFGTQDLVQCPLT